VVPFYPKQSMMLTVTFAATIFMTRQPNDFLI